MASDRERQAIETMERDLRDVRTQLKRLRARMPSGAGAARRKSILEGHPHHLRRLADVADAPSDGQYLGYDAATGKYEHRTLAGGHVAITLAADAQELLTLSTQELGLASKAANLILAGPASGGAADPTFRSLVEADIPAAIARDSELHAEAHGPSQHTEGTAWRIVYQDANGDEQEMALGADGQVFKSTGPSSAPAFEDTIETINFIIDGGGSAITTGQKGHVVVDFDCTVQGWTLLADQSGSIIIDIWKDTYANFPPTDADAMPGASKEPTLSAAQKSQDTDVTDWITITINAGDILAFNVDSASTVERVTLGLEVRRT